jgi:hypothetical protein
MLFQLIKIQRGINSVVKRRKKKEIPSIPKVIFKFNTGIHKSFVTNWKVPIDLLKPPQITRNIRKGKLEKCRVSNFSCLCAVGFVKISTKIPINGIIKE